ncbi:MAG: thioredoxin family protein [Thermoproteota archaeon]|nr:thioredoxin family protein [Candidatus Bathyarchaeota archaeon]
MKEITLEIIGPDPPCIRCLILKKNVQKAVEKLKGDGINVDIKNLDIMSEETTMKYGFLISPAMAINGTVRFMGRVPGKEEIERVIMEAYHSG